MDGPPESNEARGKGLARYYGRFIPNLPLRGKLGWMTPRSRCENDAGYETRLPRPPIPSGGLFFSRDSNRENLNSLDSSNLALRNDLKSPHHPRLQETKIIKSNHLFPRHLRHFLAELHMQERPQRRRLHLDHLPLDLPPRHHPHSHESADRIRPRPPRLEIRILLSDFALPRTLRTDDASPEQAGTAYTQYRYHLRAIQTALCHPLRLMAPSSPEALQANLKRLSQRNRDIAVSYIYTELLTGLLSCRFIRNTEIIPDAKKAWHLEYARKALEHAETAMWKLQLSGVCRFAIWARYWSFFTLEQTRARCSELPSLGQINQDFEVAADCSLSREETTDLEYWLLEPWAGRSGKRWPFRHSVARRMRCAYLAVTAGRGASPAAVFNDGGFNSLAHDLLSA
jgi:hypothetical protein